MTSVDFNDPIHLGKRKRHDREKRTHIHLTVNPMQDWSMKIPRFFFNQDVKSKPIHISAISVYACKQFIF